MIYVTINHQPSKGRKTKEEKIIAEMIFADTDTPASDFFC